MPSESQARLGRRSLRGPNEWEDHDTSERLCRERIESSGGMPAGCWRMILHCRRTQAVNGKRLRTAGEGPTQVRILAATLSREWVVWPIPAGSHPADHRWTRFAPPTRSASLRSVDPRSNRGPAIGPLAQLAERSLAHGFFERPSGPLKWSAELYSVLSPFANRGFRSARTAHCKREAPGSTPGGVHQVAVAEWSNASACRAEYRRFESDPRLCAPGVSVGEGRCPFKAEVEGSIPFGSSAKRPHDW